MTQGSRLFENGETLCGRFVVERFLGRGTVGEGCVALDKLLDERVVCKVALETGDRATAEFQAQYRKLRRIRSSGVVQVLGYDVHNTRPVILLEWLEGIDLEEWANGQPQSVRLSALADIANALSELHAEGVTHGDLWGGVNVIAASERGCVLIDPDPELWGHTSGSTERRGDRASLAFLIEMFAAPYAKSVLRPIVEGLQDGARATLPTHVAAEQLRSVATNAPAVVGDQGALNAAGASYSARIQAINERYRENRVRRHVAIEGLAMRVEALVKKFGIEFTNSGGDEAMESSRDASGLGWFLGRAMSCRTNFGSRWNITFEEIRDFGKPWPYLGGECLALGTWQSGTRQGKIELNFRDGALVFSATDGNVNVLAFPPPEEELHPLDDAWLLARLADLTGVDVVP